MQPKYTSNIQGPTKPLNAQVLTLTLLPKEEVPKPSLNLVALVIVVINMVAQDGRT